jgi:hypothetical protein
MTSIVDACDDDDWDDINVILLIPGSGGATGGAGEGTPPAFGNSTTTFSDFGENFGWAFSQFGENA